MSIEKKKENGKRYKVSIVKLDLHTKIYIWPPTHPRWKKIEDFEPYSDQPFLAVKFATYQGTMLHEQQHVKELIEAWNQCYPKFVADVNAIYTRRKKKAEKEYSKLFAKLEKDVDAEYHKHGEVKAEQIEWEYYRAEYEKHVLKLVEAAIGTP